MGRYILARLVQLVLVLLGISTVLFFLMRLSGDPASAIAGEYATPEQIQRIRQQFGLDLPLYQQYVRFVWQISHLDFGDSFAQGSLTNRTSAMGLVTSRLPATLQLGATSMLIAVIVSIPLGIFAAVTPRSPVTILLTSITIVGQSLPSFWLGLLLIILFAVVWRLLPPFGYGGPEYFVLPAITLAILPLARLVRLVRSGMLEVLGMDYVRTARAKGLPEGAVLWGHALRNTLIPVITVIGVQLGQLVGGSVIVETIFNWPGVGAQLIRAVSGRDYPVVQATVFVIAAFVVVINLLVDLTYRWLDPRIQYE